MSHAAIVLQIAAEFAVTYAQPGIPSPAGGEFVFPCTTELKEVQLCAAAAATKEKMETKRTIIFLLGLFIFPLSRSHPHRVPFQVSSRREPPP